MIFGYSITKIVFLYAEKEREIYFEAFLNAASYFTDNLCHWVITEAYIRVSFETRMLLKKETYTKSACELVNVGRFRCRLIAANVAVISAIVAISVYGYLASISNS
jgi:hypothetical protein